MKKIFNFFDILFVFFIIWLLVYSSISYANAKITTPIVSFLIGFAFVFSKRLKDLSLIERAFYWFCQNMILPRTSYNYLVVGLIMLLCGMGSLSSLSKTDIEANKMLYESMKISPSFWIMIFFVIIFNGLIGILIYRHIKFSKKGLNEIQE